MTTKNAKTVLFASLMTISILSLGGINSAQAQETTPEQEAQFDEFIDQVLQLQQDNIKYADLPDTPEKIELIARNLDRIDEFIAQADVIFPPDPTVEIEPQLKEQMIDAQYALMESELPLLEAYVGSSTGLLTITVDKERSTDLMSSIQDFIGEDIPIEVRYALNTAVFQGSCNTSTGYCNPLIGGSLGEDQTNGLGCTVSIAVVRDNWPWGTEDGIIIPDHCNPNTSDYYQANNAISSHRVGLETKDGGWFCDCDFIKADSRTINTAKINNGGSDVSLTGNADIADERQVILFGAVSGADNGRIKEVNVSKDFNGHTFHDLYKIQYISYTDGDRGAPVIYNSKYGGMNIGKDVIDGRFF